MSDSQKYLSGRDFWDGTVCLSAAAQKIYKSSTITFPYESHELELTVYISCYNEEESIIDSIATVIEAMEVVGKSYEILVIDDGSQDGSVDKIRQYIDAHPQICIVMRANKTNKGVAQNYVDGAFIGCGKYYYLVHGNNSEPVEMMVDVLRALGEADILVPYYIATNRKMDLWREFLSNSYIWLLNIASGHRINYYNSMQVHLRYNVMRWHSDVLGFGFQADLLCRLLDLGFTCKQVPCRDAAGRIQRNTITLRNLLSVLHIVIDVILRRLSRRLHKQ